MVAEVLEAGGCPSGVREDLPEHMAFSGALLETVVAGLEVAGWSLKGFRKHEIFDVALQAGREATNVVAAKFDTSPPLSMKLVGGSLTMRIGTMLAPGVMPFDLEAYLERHFTKVSDQTREELETFIESGKEYGVSVDGLEQLRAALEEAGR
jgi:2-dehydropantoate 2-reductase